MDRVTRDETDTLTQEIPLPRVAAPHVPELLPWAPAARPAHARRIPGPVRNPAAGLPVLILAGLIAAFLGWVSAQPFWISVGAGTAGTVTISSCAHGRCTGSFSGSVSGGDFTADGVRLSSVPGELRKPGSTVAAHMLTPGSGWAYAGRPAGLALRWQIGLAIVLGSAIAAGAATGIRGLRSCGRRRQLLLWAMTLAGPLALFGGALLAALI
jgi:hypothetical protein